MYLNDWSESKAEGMCRDFEIEMSTLDEIEILIASYTYEDCNGIAFVLFEKGGKLFEVNGSHCSCYRLEGQWESEETTLEALMARKTWYWDGHGNGFIGIIKQALSK